jgi:lysophospholipase L1-like esterase
MEIQSGYWLSNWIIESTVRGERQPADANVRTVECLPGFFGGQQVKAGRYTYCLHDPYNAQPKASFPHANKNTLDAVFPGHRCLNPDFGWDRTQNVLWRIDHGELDGLHPLAVILHIGTNNMGETSNARQNTPEEIVVGIRQIITRIRSKTPEARIILMAVFPRGQIATDTFRLETNQINKLLATEIGKTPGITLLDIGPKPIQPDGTISSDVMFDFLHLTDKDYQIWANAITPLVK